MLLIDIDDTLNFITLGVNFDLIINSQELELEDKKQICTETLVGFLDQDTSQSKELEEYLINNHKQFVPRLAWSKDTTESIVNYLDAGQYSILYRGSVGKERYFETGGSVCEEINDKLMENGINPKQQYNVSFFFNKDIAKKIIKDYAEIYTASFEMAKLADEIDGVERIFFQLNSSNYGDKLASESNTEKIILVDNLFHLCQIRQILSQ